jgi:hypothetical protein
MSNLEKTRKLTKEETAELYAVRVPNPDQLVVLAEKCRIETEIKGNVVLFKESPHCMWDPQDNLAQNHALLAAVIAKGDCRLFYDDGVHEYFIYRYKYVQGSDGPPLAHNTNLQDTVLQAALELWFPEEE